MHTALWFIAGFVAGILAAFIGAAITIAAVLNQSEAESQIMEDFEAR